MQFYIAIDGEKQGPHSIYRVTEMLRDEQISPEVLGWHQGREKWTPLSEIPALGTTIKSFRDAKLNEAAEEAGVIERPEESVPEAAEEAPAESEDSEPAAAGRKVVLANEVRPFTRFWARSFDYMLVYTVVWMIAGVPIPADVSSWDWMRNPDQFYGEEAIVRLTVVTFGAFTIWHVIEAILLHTVGTTPGKALFSIRIRRVDGGRPRLTRTLARSFFVWVVGFGLGIFPFNLLAMTFGFFRLLSTGVTLWDKQLRLYVQHTPMGPARILLAVAAFALLMALQQLVFT